ncbi:MAG: amino acid racemase [Streptosporangiales bacterium]|nr:amino acid racemase [Streptosporangiales bacterium]
MTGRLTVGILGGMRPAATVDFYDKLVRATPAGRDQDHLRVIIWADPAVPDRTAALLEGGDDPRPVLRAGAVKLAASGADLLAVPCNTAHAFVPEIAAAVGLPLVSIIDTTADTVRAARPARVGLLATTGTVASRLYHDAIEPSGVTVLAPGDAAQAQVMTAIQAVKSGDLGTAGPLLAGAAAGLIEAGAELIIAGCTEVVLALPEASRPLLDPARLLAERVVEIARTGRLDPSRAA